MSSRRPPSAGRSRSRPSSAKSAGSGRNSGISSRPKIEVDYVHGYRGARCRNNMFALESGEIVYHTAAMCVVLDPRDGTQRYLRGVHDDDIISLCVHPDGRTVATGQVGRNPKIVVWDSVEMRPISVLQGFHTRGICALSFAPAEKNAGSENSKDSKMIYRLVSVGLDDYHSVAVWDWRSGHRLVTSKGSGDRIFEVEVEPRSGKAVTVGVKHVAFWEFSRNVVKKKKGIFGKVAPVQTMLCVMPGKADGLVYTGSLSGDIYVWDPTTRRIQSVVKGAHKGPVYAMWEYESGFVTSGKDGVLRFWDKAMKPVDKLDLAAFPVADGAVPVPRAISRHRSGKIYLGCKTSDILEVDERSKAISLVHTGHDEGEVWGLATHPKDQEYATCSDDGTVRVWSCRERKQLRVRNLGRDARSCAYTPDGSAIAVGFEDGSFAVLDERTLETVHSAKHCRECISDVRFSPDGRTLAVASHDNFIDFYDARNGFKRVGRGKGHSSYVTHIDWSSDSRMLQSNSGDYETLYWDATGKRITRKPPGAEWDEKSRSMAWETWTAVLGDAVEGIWPKYSDKTDVNSVDLAAGARVLATGDDFGSVKLFAWPPSNPGARHSKYPGHSSHVTNVRFTAGGKFLISVGGADQTVVQWSFGEDGGSSVTESDDEMDMDLEEVDSELEEELSRQYKLKPSKEELQATKRLVSAQESLAAKLEARISGARGSDDSEDDSEDEREELSKAARDLAMATARANNVAVPTDLDAGKAGVAARAIAGSGASSAASSSSASSSSAAASSSSPSPSSSSSSAAAGAVGVSRSEGAAGVSSRSAGAGSISAPVREVAVRSGRSRRGGKKKGGFAFGDPRRSSEAAVNTRRKKKGARTAAAGEKPAETLRLDFVHGYRGHDTRDNLYYTADGKIVYHAAATGIVYDPKTHKQAFFHGHDDDIISLAVHPKRNIVATGQIGKEPMICVWSTETMRPLAVLKGFHKRGIPALAFSPDGAHLVSVGRDDSNSVAVYRWEKGYLLAHAKGHSDKIVGVEWDPQSATGFVTCGVKHISFWTMLGNTIEKKKGLFGRKAKLQTLLSCAYTSAKNDSVTYVGAANGDVYKFNGRKVSAVVDKAHAGCTFSIQPSSAGFVSGGKDGVVRTWDPSFKPLKRFELKDELGKSVSIRSVDWHKGKILCGTSASQIFEIDEATGKAALLLHGHAAGELWGLAVHPAESKFATCSEDATLRLWDLRSQKQIRRVQLSRGALSAAFSPDGAAIAVGLSNGAVTVHRADNLEEVARFRHRKEKICAIAFSPDGRMLAVGSNDNFIDLYKVNLSGGGGGGGGGRNSMFRRYAVCKGHSSFIVNLDWSTNSKYLQSDCGAHEHLYWFAANGKIVTKKSALVGVEWATMTCALDDSASATPAPYSDKTDINAVSRNSTGSLLVTADDFGFVKLFKYPADNNPRQASKKAVGHASHVTNARFTADDRCVLTTGGNDQCVFAWSVVRDELQSDDSPDEFSDSDSDLAEDLADPTFERGGSVRKRPNSDLIAKYSQPQTDVVEEQSAKKDGSSVVDIRGSSSGGGRRAASHHGGLSTRELIALQSGDPLASIRRGAVQGDLPLMARMSRRQRQRNFNAPGGSSGSGGGPAGHPDATLELEFVHGVRAHDCYNNVFPSARGEIVFHAAATGVVYDKRSHTQRHFVGHDDDILSLHMHPDGVLVATGEIGKSPKVVVWSTADCTAHAELKGAHYRGVNCVAFSRKGNRLATVGLDDHHTLCIWKWRTSDLIASEKGHTDKILSASWAPGDAYLVTTGVKHVKFWFVLGNQVVGKKGLFGSKGSIQTVIDTAFSHDGRCFTSMASGAIYEWVNATGKGKTKPAFKCNRVVVPDGGQGHTGPVFGLAETKTGFVTGGKDGKLCFWDSNWRQTSAVKVPTDGVPGAASKNGAKPPCVRSAAFASNSQSVIVALKHGEILEASERDCQSLLLGHGIGELWGLATHPSRGAYVTCSDDRTIRVWDVKTRKCIKFTHTKKGARCAAYSPDGAVIAVGFVDGSWAAYDAGSLQMLAHKKHAREWLQDLKFSPDGSKLAVGSHDNFIDIYSVERNFKRIARCKGFSSFITHLDWSDDSETIQAEDGAHEHLYFSANDGKHITRSSQLAGAEWDTWTCILGYPVGGIWGKSASDNTDINACDRNKESTLIATADDFGDVKLFAWPATGPQEAPYEGPYITHSSHVTNVRFTADDAHLISTGGNDQTIMQWRVVRNRN